MEIAPSQDRLHAKLRILADAAKYDASCASSGSRRGGQSGALGSTAGNGICHSYTPDGRCVSLLKILLTNHCVYDCLFCVNRVSSDVPRARFTPEEVVSLTMSFYRRNYIEGLFLSSGIARSPDDTAEEMIAVARSLREVHRFNGYVHLKIVPGTSAALIAVAGRYADRLSANIELATQGELDLLAPEKRIDAAENSMVEIGVRVAQSEAERAADVRAPLFAPAGQSTQLVLGATATPDATIIDTAERLYRRHRLRRVYYTAFSPFPRADPRLPLKAAPLVREHRLYQADWLIRHYGFKASELTTPELPNLDLHVDPKEAWALRHRARFPVDLNRADREAMLRVPGLGRTAVDRILAARRHRAITLDDLGRLRVPLSRVRPFVVVRGHNPSLALLDRLDLAKKLELPRQLSLFSAAANARTGEL